MLPPTIFGVSEGVIVTTFVTIRYTELPLILYMIYPSIALDRMFVIFWMCYEAVLLVRASEEIVGQLASHDAKFLRPLPRALRMEVLKVAKAMKPIEIPLGHFAKFSISLPIAIWDEILNQVLFLLSF